MACYLIVAIGVGGVEALGLISGRLQMTGAFWDAVDKANNNFGALGYFIVGLFVLSLDRFNIDLQMAAL